MKKLILLFVFGLSMAACSERNPPRNDNGSGLPGNEQREEDMDKEDGNHGDDDTRSEQEERSN